MNHSSPLAIHGGEPVRTKPFSSWPQFGRPEEERVVAALRTGVWGKMQGDEVRQFEQAFAEYHEAKHGFGVVNGTVALRIALTASGVGAGDEVIVPPYTFVATASAVLEVNATPVFADVDLATSNLSPVAIEAAITPRTRAIIPVHLGGLPCDMDAIMEIARRHGLLVIEDACHAHGARYKDRSIGSLGHMSCFSFQSSKNVTAGEGGILLTNDDDLARKCWSIHNCGRVPEGKWYEHHTIGGNYRLSELQGALLNAQWERFDEQARRREENGRYLDDCIGGIDGIRPQLRTGDCTRHAYHLCSFRVDPLILGISREVFLEALVAEGMPAMAGYPIPLYREPIFLERSFGPYTGGDLSQPGHDYGKVSCPNCEILSTQQACWLPHYVMLGTKEDIEEVAAAIFKVCDHRTVLAGQARGTTTRTACPGESSAKKETKHGLDGGHWVKSEERASSEEEST
jgi:dTDP-4-amino-4,6-dideoxygalactose transaminase